MKLQSVLNHIAYESAHVALILLSILLSAFRDEILNRALVSSYTIGYNLWSKVYFLITTIFLLDFLVHLLAFGTKLFSLKPAYKWELILQLINLLISIIYVMKMIRVGYQNLEAYQFEAAFVGVTMLRLIILVKYLLIVQDIRIIVYISNRLASSFLSILFTFYLVTFVYETVG